MREPSRRPSPRRSREPSPKPSREPSPGPSPLPSPGPSPPPSPGPSPKPSREPPLGPPPARPKRSYECISTISRLRCMLWTVSSLSAEQTEPICPGGISPGISPGLSSTLSPGLSRERFRGSSPQAPGAVPGQRFPSVLTDDFRAVLTVVLAEVSPAVSAEVCPDYFAKDSTASRSTPRDMTQTASVWNLIRGHFPYFRPPVRPLVT